QDKGQAVGAAGDRDRNKRPRLEATDRVERGGQLRHRQWACSHAARTFPRIGTMRPSRRPLCRLLRMTFLLNSIKYTRHPEERPKGASRRKQDRIPGRLLHVAKAPLCVSAPQMLLLRRGTLSDRCPRVREIV